MSFEGAANLAYNALVAFECNDRVTAWNARAEEMFGLAREQAVGRGLAQTILPERYRAAHYEGLRRFRETGRSPLLDKRMQLSAQHSDGHEFPVELTITAVGNRSGYTFYALVADRPELRSSERERERLLAELRSTLSGTEQRFAVTLDALAEAVTIRGEGDRLLYANHAALTLMGLDSVEQLRATDPHALLLPYSLTAANGGKLGVENLPSTRVLRGERPEPLLLRAVAHASGEERWSLLKAAPIRAPDGSVEAAVTIIEDVTAEHRAGERAEFLSQAGKLLASSLDYQQTLNNVAGLAVPKLADWCAVDLIDERGRRLPVALVHRDADKQPLAERMRVREDGERDPRRGLGRLMRAGAPTLHSEVSQELLSEIAIDTEHLQLLREIGIGAALSVPLRVAGRTIGALTMVDFQPGRSFGADDLAFAEQLAERAALAVENARLYRERSELARTLQRSLLPDALPRIPGWEIAALYRPAGHESEVGGDFYDVWRVGEDWLVLIGDVTGKGVAAATLTSLARHSALTASEFDPRPSQILMRMDAALRRRPTMSLCTALCMRISRQRVAIASAGHPLPLHLARGEVREIGRHGLLLGVSEGVARPEDAVEMRAGESLVAITDGVIDARGARGERFGSARLSARMAGVRDEPPMLILQQLIAGVEEFQVGPQADDTAVLVARFTGSSSQAPPGAHPPRAPRASTAGAPSAEQRESVSPLGAEH